MKMNDIKINEFDLVNGKIAVFQYVGQGDPVGLIDEAVSLYTRDEYKSTEMIDISMDNPWVRVVISDLDKIKEGGTELTTDILREFRLRSLLKDN